LLVLTEGYVGGEGLANGWRPQRLSNPSFSQRGSAGI
jgi:hypothetical protein